MVLRRFGGSAPPRLLASAVLLMLLAACTGSELGDGGSSTLLADSPSTVVDYQMALGAIEEIVAAESEALAGVESTVAVVVPSDETLLGLDADRLATIARDGDLEALVIRLQPSDDIDLTSPAQLQSAASDLAVLLTDSDGAVHVLRPGLDPATFDDLPIRRIDRQDPITIIVVDGIAEQ